jgi:hypothetical protein
MAGRHANLGSIDPPQLRLLKGKSKRTSALVNKGVPEKDVLPKYCPDKPPLVNPPPFARVLLLTAKSPRYVVGLGDEEELGGDAGQAVQAGEGCSLVRARREGAEGAIDCPPACAGPHALKLG